MYCALKERSEPSSCARLSSSLRSFDASRAMTGQRRRFSRRGQVGGWLEQCGSASAFRRAAREEPERKDREEAKVPPSK